MASNNQNNEKTKNTFSEYMSFQKINISGLTKGTEKNIKAQGLSKNNSKANLSTSMNKTKNEFIRSSSVLKIYNSTGSTQENKAPSSKIGNLNSTITPTYSGLKLNEYLKNKAKEEENDRLSISPTKERANYISINSTKKGVKINFMNTSAKDNSVSNREFSTFTNRNTFKRSIKPNQLNFTLNKNISNTNTLDSKIGNNSFNNIFSPLSLRLDNTGVKTILNDDNYNQINNDHIKNSTIKTKTIIDSSESNCNPISQNISPAQKFRVVKPKKPTKIRLVNPGAGMELSSGVRDVNLNLNVNMNFNILNHSENMISSNSKTMDISSPKILSLESPVKTSKNNFLYDNSNYKKQELGVNARTGNCQSGRIVSFGVNTHNGNIRNYNEDRVSIILNLVNPNLKKNEKWPQISFFGLYDGHAGTKCAEFLKENLHHYIFKERDFLLDPKSAIFKGFAEAERRFLSLAFNDPSCTTLFERSGSCALVVILIEDICYVANVGDSRALLSEECSSIVRQLSKDHRPDDESEKNRVQKAGGSVYITKYHDLNTNKEESGPVRILPGKLSVSRSFGDVHAKVPKLGGNEKVLIALPEVRSFKIKDSTDFIVIGCDGIFEKMSNLDIIHSIWSMARENSIAPDIHEHCGRCVDMILKNCLKIGAGDNLTLILLSFKNFKNNLYNLKFENGEKRFSHLNKIKSKIFENLTEDSFKLLDENEEDNYNHSSTPKSDKDSSLLSFSNGVSNNRNQDLSSLPIISKLSKK